MNQKDRNALTEYWRQQTNYLNTQVDEAFREAQDHAYELGVEFGKSEAWQKAEEAMKEASKVISELCQLYGHPTPDATLNRLLLSNN